MATLTVSTSARGTIKATGNSGRGTTYDNVRENSTFVTSTTNNPTSDDTSAILYNKVSDGRGGSQWSFNRTYAYFDLTSLPAGATVTGVELAITSSGADLDDGVYVLSSSAFSNGTSTLVSSEYYTSIDYTVPYGTKITSWPANGASALYSLNSDAIDDVQDNNRLVMAFVDTADYNDTDTGFLISSTRAGFKFSEGATVMQLKVTYTPAAAGDIASIDGVSFTNINKFDNIVKASISQINGINTS